MQVVDFYERNSGGVVYPTHDGGAVTRWEVCDNRRFARVPREQLALRRGKCSIAAYPGTGAVGRYDSEMISSVRS